MTAEYLNFTRMLKNFRKFCKENGSWLGSGSARKYDGSAQLDQVLARAQLDQVLARAQLELEKR